MCDGEFACVVKAFTSFTSIYNIKDDLRVISPPSFGFGFSLFIFLVGFAPRHICGTFHGLY
jgi:hypothetical protein